LKTHSYYKVLVRVAISVCILFATMLVLHKQTKDTQFIKTEIRLSSNELIQELNNSQNKHLDVYIDKAIEIKGKLKDVVYKNNKYSIFLTGNNLDSLVLCEMQKNQTDIVENLEIGSDIVIKGIFKGVLMDAILLNCIIIKGQ